jgi:hypothetical protein
MAGPPAVAKCPVVVQDVLRRSTASPPSTAQTWLLAGLTKAPSPLQNVKFGKKQRRKLKKKIVYFYYRGAPPEQRASHCAVETPHQTRMHGNAKPMRELQNLLPRADCTVAYAWSVAKAFKCHPVRGQRSAPKQH